MNNPYGKFIFISPEKEKEFNELEPEVKREVAHLISKSIEEIIQDKQEETPCK